MTVDLTCPYCGSPNDGASGPPGQTPGEGDVCLCWTCAMPGIVEDASLRLPTEQELLEVTSHPDYLPARAAILGARAVGANPIQAAEVVWGTS